PELDPVHGRADRRQGGDQHQRLPPAARADRRGLPELLLARLFAAAQRRRPLPRDQGQAEPEGLEHPPPRGLSRQDAGRPDERRHLGGAQLPVPEQSSRPRPRLRRGPEAPRRLLPPARRGQDPLGQAGDDPARTGPRGVGAGLRRGARRAGRDLRGPADPRADPHPERRLHRRGGQVLHLYAHPPDAAGRAEGRGGPPRRRRERLVVHRPDRAGGGLRVAGLTREIRGLGQALVDVLRAELAALERDLARSGGELSKGLGLFGAAAALAFWAIGALVVAAIAGLAVWLPLWGA